MQSLQFMNPSRSSLGTCISFALPPHPRGSSHFPSLFFSFSFTFFPFSLKHSILLFNSALLLDDGNWYGRSVVQYTVAGKDGPAILLVHGFGAFWEHYRDNIHGLDESGNRVWAITILGFGKSEKPNVVYTELLWAELFRHFIVDIVGEPVQLLGNSGYLAIIARIWSDLIKSIVLINSAGNLIPRYSFIPLSTIQDRQTSGASWLGSRILLFYLRYEPKNYLRNVIQLGLKEQMIGSQMKCLEHHMILACLWCWKASSALIFPYLLTFFLKMSRKRSKLYRG